MNHVDVVEAIRLYEEEGLPSSLIAERMGVTRHAVWRRLRSAGVDTSKGGRNLQREVVCTWCDRDFRMNRARYRERLKLGRFFCTRECYIQWVKHQGSDYSVSRYGQRAARREVERYYGELPGGSVVHHIDKVCINNDKWNLILFASHSDHMKWHRGDCDGIEPLWRGDL